MNMRNENKQPIVRPGQRKPYVKATRKEVRQRLNAAAALEYWYYEKSEIHWFFQFVFGVESRQTDRYLARARARACKSDPLALLAEATFDCAY
jgi:hypothetical protein